MKTITPISGLLKIGRAAGIFAAFLFLLMITNTSCYEGRDGLPGKAFLAVEWEVDKPDYIDCGTPDIPPQFYYGTYYRAYPGVYFLYYEGDFYNGQAWGTYAWEMEYEIWVHPGERGGLGYNGAHGPDAFFQLVCSPYGPYKVNTVGKTAGKILVKETYKLIEETENGIVIEQKQDAYTLKITYRKVEPKHNHNTEVTDR
ncbi:MAG: hypothetical protein RQ866_00940 [Bacteroidales bacterium]|nr:hypothetical protein [Bacteroidales bacterium]